MGYGVSSGREEEEKQWRKDGTDLGSAENWL